MLTISPVRLLELKKLTEQCTVDSIFVTAFLDRNTFRQFAPDIAWETEVWIADAPDHLTKLAIHPHPSQGWGWIARRKLTTIHVIIKLVDNPPDCLKGYLREEIGIQSTSRAQGRDLPRLVGHRCRNSKVSLSPSYT
ncbi:MAG: hypothetical protein F6K55_15240, partial [Moorea sp. SIO4A3]|nr:hypothetical protein [Moorena sp. SIO4A3]